MVDNKKREINKLIPEYLESDFGTSLIKNVDLLKKSDTFKDYNYHGANMTMILELLSYLTDFNSFHTNMVAKNVYMESANVYETVHSLAMQKGYYPKGYISSYTTISCSLSGTSNGQPIISDDDDLLIQAWQPIDIGLESRDGNALTYNTTKQYEIKSVQLINDITSFEFQMKEGTIETLNFKYTDIINNEIFLPFHHYDYGTFPYIVPSVSVVVNGESWERVDEFYEGISGLESEDYDDVYMLVFDKYNRYVIRFDTSRNVPGEVDDIVVNLLDSNGPDGVISTNAIDLPAMPYFNIINTTTGLVIPYENIIKFTNEESSILGSLPENIQEIKVSSKANIHSQYRNVTAKDYRYDLESRTDIDKGSAWGEQEVNPGNILEYNKVYISVIPPEGLNSLFASGTINTELVLWVERDDPELHAYVEEPTTYNTVYRDDLLVFLEPRKMLNCYEIPITPNLVYFRFDIGIRVKRTYTYIDVMNNVRSKLEYFFDRMLRDFYEEISFMDIHNFIMDQSITAPDNNFETIRGVENLVLREISTFTYALSGDKQEIFEPNTDNLYPQYKNDSYDGYVDNKLRTIKLGYDQFPMLVIDMCRFYIES